MLASELDPEKHVGMKLWAEYGNGAWDVGIIVEIERFRRHVDVYGFLGESPWSIPYGSQVRLTTIDPRLKKVILQRHKDLTSVQRHDRLKP